jgi:RES domain-containing protein
LSALSTIARRLALAPRIQVQEELVRKVAFLDLISNLPPNFLYTSGKPARYNPAGIMCVYFGEDEDTVSLEYKRLMAGTKKAKQPVTTFFAKIKLNSVLDLTSDATVKALKLRPQDLHKDWRGVSTPTETQKLGLIVATRSSISAIRFPSDAAAASGKAGSNIVIYRKNVGRPDFVKILGPDKSPLQAWP